MAAFMLQCKRWWHGCAAFDIREAVDEHPPHRPRRFRSGSPELRGCSPRLSARGNRLVERLELGPGKVVVDLGAGTGKLTRRLADTGARTLAVEPVEEMRRLMRDDIEAVDGTAEAIPLEDAVADAVTVAQAFHWFDGPVALAGIHRVLHRHGQVALVWTIRPLEDPVHAAVEGLIRPYWQDVPREPLGLWRRAFERTHYVGPFEQARFPYVQAVNADELATRVGSISAIAALPDGERERVLAQVRNLVTGDRLHVSYRCDVMVAPRLSVNARAPRT